jgi:hypothetical protein
MMKKWFAAIMWVLLVNSWGISAHAQDVTVGEVKSKGATVLSAEEVKSLLSGATVSYENSRFRTQMKLDADGTVTGSSSNRIGSAGGSTIVGKWNVNDQGRWCADVGRTAIGGTKYCRTVLKAADKHYYVNGAANDDSRAAVEFSVRR